jgi:acyl carrier protein
MKLDELFSLVLGERCTNMSMEQINPTTIRSWDSLGHIRLVTAVEDTYNVSFTSREIMTMRSLADFQRVLSCKGVEL